MTEELTQALAAPSHRVRVFVLLGLVAGVCISSALWLTHREPASSHAPSPVRADATSVTMDGDAPQWRYVKLAVAEEGPPLAPLPAPGRVDLNERATSAVGSPLSGRVEEVVVRLGDRVTGGNRLFSIRSGAYAELEREVRQAEEALRTQQRLVERLRGLVELRAVPQKELLAAEAELRSQELSQRAARSKQASLRVTAQGDNLFWVSAPRAGTIVSHNVSVGEEVTPDRDTPLLRISDLKEVRVLADVREEDAAELQEGMAVQVRVRSGQTLPGVLERVSELVDPVRRAVEVRVRVVNQGRLLRPNGFVEVLLPSRSTTTRVRVPSEAVVTSGDKSVVFVAKEAGRLERQSVVPGRQRDGWTELRAGLEPGMRYVSQGALLLQNAVELAR